MFKSYTKKSHISVRKFRKILRCFSEDITATTTSKFTKINRTTINKIYTAIREKIAEECERDSVFERGEMVFD